MLTVLEKASVSVRLAKKWTGLTGFSGLTGFALRNSTMAGPQVF
jgi:hypothetical protein